MVTPSPTKAKDDAKIYPEALYYAERYSQCGHQPVFKRLLPDGEPTELSPEPSQKLNDHSLDVFQWGYSGSGPAQLALALLLDATTDPEMALAHYQQFKWDKVATWGDAWRITKSEILLWLEIENAHQLLARQGRN